MHVVLLATACYAATVALGGILKDDRIWNLGMTALAGNAVIAALTQVQAGTNYAVWNLAALAAAGIGARHWKRFTGQWPRAERRALAQLFGEPTLGDMLFRDPRLGQR